MPLCVDYITENRVRFLISGEMIAALRQGYSEWTRAFFKFQDPKFRSVLLGRELNTIRTNQDRDCAKFTIKYS